MKQIVNDNDDFPNSQIMFSIQWYQICLTKKKKKNSTIKSIILT